MPPGAADKCMAKARNKPAKIERKPRATPRRRRSEPAGPFDLDTYLKVRRNEVEAELRRCTRAAGDGRLAEASRYALLGGGKRLRPVLALAGCEAAGGDPKDALAAACALEMVHTYSLVHDDLPAMDDDDLRRGRPTTHKKYDEATAILVGDALLTEAFTILADPRLTPALDDHTRVQLIHTLGKGAGWQGMVLGQAVDLESEGKAITAKELRVLHGAKTGALLSASVKMGGLCARAGAREIRALETYGKAIGLAFQIVDDILDVTSDTQTLGKTVGADEAHEKSTFPKLMGLESSRKEADRLIRRAKSALTPFGERAAPLSALADYVVERVN